MKPSVKVNIPSYFYLKLIPKRLSYLPKIKMSLCIKNTPIATGAPHREPNEIKKILAKNRKAALKS
jgi:hypothetical protein